MSIAGTATLRQIIGPTAAADPARAKATTRASRGISPASRQVASSEAASAPTSSTKSVAGSRALSARSVSTVYDGPGRPSSIRSRPNRGSLRMASATISARCSGVAPCAPCLNGCSRAGTNLSESRPSASSTALAAIRWPWWIGSKDPPSRPIIRASGGSRRGRTGLRHPRSLGVEPAQVAAGFLHVLLVSQLLVGPDEPYQRLRRHRGARVIGDQVLEVEDRGVVGFEPQVIQGRLVL